MSRILGVVNFRINICFAAALALPDVARTVGFNIWSGLDDSPVSYHITEPVDPTEYYSSDVGSVVGDLY